MVDPQRDAQQSARDTQARESIVGWRRMKQWQIWTIAIAAVAFVVVGAAYVA